MDRSECTYFWEDEALIGKISRHFGLTSIELEEPPTRCRRFPKYRNFEGHDEHIRHRRGYVEAGGTRLMDLELFVGTRFLTLYPILETKIAIYLYKFGSEGIEPEGIEQITLSKITHRAIEFDIPFDIIKAWARGELEGEGTKLAAINEYAIIYEGEGHIEYPYALYKWFTSLGERPFDRLKNLMTEDMYKILMKRLEGPKVEAIRIPKKDRERLKVMDEVKGPLSLSKWAEMLGLRSKGSTHALLKRLEGQGLIRLDRREEGVLIELTDRGRAVL
jgi:uncharacterized membrane protein